METLFPPLQGLGTTGMWICSHSSLGVWAPHRDLKTFRVLRTQRGQDGTTQESESASYLAQLVLPRLHVTCGGPISDLVTHGVKICSRGPGPPPSTHLDPLGVAIISHNLCCKSPLGCITVSHHPHTRARMQGPGYEGLGGCWTPVTST